MPPGAAILASAVLTVSALLVNSRFITLAAHHWSNAAARLTGRCIAGEMGPENPTTCCDNFCFATDDKSGLSSGMKLGLAHEPWMRRVIEKFQNPKGTALDIGAHIGYHTVSMSSHFASVVALEPDEDTFRFLKRNTRQMANVTCINSAASSTDGYVPFARDNISTRSLVDKSRTSGERSGLLVRCRSLDSLMGEFTSMPPVTFIKIDVEGHEREVLHGGRNLLKQQRPVIVYEDHTGETTDFLRQTFPFYKIYPVNATNMVAVPIRN